MCKSSTPTNIGCMKIYIQATFEESFEELLLNTDLQSKKIGYEQFIKTQILDFKGNTLLVKNPQSIIEKAIDKVILTLELLYQLPVSFELSPWVEYDIKDYVFKLYESNITGQTEQNLNFVFYTSLQNKEAINKIIEFSQKVNSINTISIEIVAIPCLDSYNKNYDSKVIYDGLNEFVSLKKDGHVSDVYIIDSFDEDHIPNLWNINKLSDICSDFIVSKCTIPTDIDKDRNGNVCAFGIERLEIDKFSIINNWAFHIFKKLCDKIINKGDSDQNVDKDKVNKIFREILEEERKGLEMINNLPDNEVQPYLEKWREELKKKIIEKIVDADLNNSERQLLLSYFENITNRDLLELEEFDISNFDLFDDIYIPYIDQSLGKDNPYNKLKEIILQIQQIKKRIEERQKRINEKRQIIDKNYRRDGQWKDGGYQIGDDIFKIHHSDLLDKNDNQQGELFTQYEPKPSNTLPKSADLKKYFPPIKNQGKQGACSSFSLTSVFEYFLNNETHKKDDMSEAYVYYNAREIQGNTNIDEGANLYNVIRGMADKGVCLEELCPYDSSVFDKRPSDEAYEDGKEHTVTTAKDVPVSVETVKSAINDGFPVVGCFRVFESLQENTSGYIPMPTDNERSSEEEKFHAMVICGYNDKHGHFIVRNSWGTDFGDNGYCYLPYSYLRDSDLTRYAVAITGIDANAFIGHKPDEEDYNYDQKDSNIQYAILLNLLKEEEHKLEEDRARLKGLISELKRVIEELKNRDDLITLQDNTNEQLDKISKDITEIQKQKDEISIANFKWVHIIHAILLCISGIATGYGVYQNNQKVWIPSTIIAALSVISWIFWLWKSKNNKIKEFERQINELEEKKKSLDQTINEKNNLRNRVIMILDTIGDIDNSAHLNRDLLNAIIITLNECYDQITNYINNLPDKEIDDDGLMFPDWFKMILPYIGEIDLLKKILNESKDGDYKTVLKTVQENILRVLDEHFDKSINDIYDNGNSDAWNEYIHKIIDNKVYVKFKDNTDPYLISDYSCFLSNLYMPNIQVLSNYVYLNKNRYIYLHTKEAPLECFDLKL